MMLVITLVTFLDENDADDHIGDLFPPMPMAARGEVFQLANAPPKTSGVPEDVS